MTNLQQTVKEYTEGDKGIAYQMFLADPSANSGIPFERFCIAFDNMLQRQEENEADTKRHALAMARAG